MSWDKNYKIRWNRVGKTINEIESELRSGKLTVAKIDRDEK